MDFALINHYVQRGHDWDRVAGEISSSGAVREFLQAGMEVTIEDEVAKYKAMFGEK